MCMHTQAKGIIKFLEAQTGPSVTSVADKAELDAILAKDKSVIVTDLAADSAGSFHMLFSQCTVIFTPPLGRLQGLCFRR